MVMVFPAPTVNPPESCSVAAFPATVVMLVALPRAPALVTRRMPAAPMVIGPLKLLAALVRMTVLVLLPLMVRAEATLSGLLTVERAASTAQKISSAAGRERRHYR